MTDYIELGKRLVACKGFRWLPGMLCQRRMHTGEWVSMRLTDDTTVVDYRVVERNAVPSMNQAAARIMGEGYITLNGWVLADDLLPDLSDAATKGCVLQLVREAWGDPELFAVVMYDGRWSVRNPSSRVAYGESGTTEADAMVAALEVAAVVDALDED